MGHYIIIQTGTTKDNSLDSFPGKRKRNILDFVRPINFDYIIKSTTPVKIRNDFINELKNYCDIKIDNEEQITILKKSCKKYFEKKLAEAKPYYENIKDADEFREKYYDRPMNPATGNGIFVIFDDDECERISTFDYFMYCIDRYTQKDDLKLYIKNIFDAHY